MSKRNEPIEAETHLERITKVLNRVHVKRGNGELLQAGDRVSLDGEGVEWRNPLTEIIEAEEREENNLAADVADLTDRMNAGLEARLPDGEAKDKLLAFIAGEAQELAFRAFESLQAAFLEWVFAAGPNPLDVDKRLFAYAKQKRPDLLSNMSFRDLGALFGETHATMHARCEALFEGIPAGWKKTETACRNMSRAQEGNGNRRIAERKRRLNGFEKKKPQRKKHANNHTHTLAD